MENANAEIIDLIKSYIRDEHQMLDPLTRKISGTVNPAVMGGIANYEKAFLCPEYETTHPEDEEKLNALKMVIAAQMPLLEAALQIHSLRVSGK